MPDNRVKDLYVAACALSRAMVETEANGADYTAIDEQWQVLTAAIMAYEQYEQDCKSLSPREMANILVAAMKNQPPRTYSYDDMCKEIRKRWPNLAYGTVNLVFRKTISLLCET